MTAEAQTAPTTDITLSEAAAAQINAQKDAQGNDKMMLRVSVMGGGCSGFKYQLSFDEESFGDDTIFEKDGAKIVVDEMSLEMLAGTQIDFQESMMGASFVIRNPNAASSCGCGSSFSA